MNLLKKIALAVLRLIAVLASLVLLLLLLSGLLLKYEQSLGLSEIAVSEHLFAMGDAGHPQAHQALGFNVGGHWYFSYQDTIYKNTLPWKQCEGAFISVLKIENILALACEDSIKIIENDQVIREISKQQIADIAPVQRLGRIKQQVFFETQFGVFNLDLKALDIYLAPVSVDVNWVEQESVPAWYISSIHAKQQNLYQVLHYLHSFKFENEAMNVVLDLLLLVASLLLIALVVLLLNRIKLPST